MPMLKSLLALGFITSILGWMPLPTVAQITPDASLGVEPSRLSPTNTIEGGARRGANLFHSFSEFSINEGQRIDFANPAGIDRILTRVTGGARSQILGTLGVLGNADLFLLNPNGIVFGTNAQLDVSGSFIVSTAESLFFQDGFSFSASNPQTPPLLTIHVPIGLQYGTQVGNIQVQQASLQVATGKTLAFVGGSIEIEGASLNAIGGRIELAGVKDAGTVDLALENNLWQIKPINIKRADITVTNSAFMDVRSANGGSIAIQADNGKILNGSTLRAGIASRRGTLSSQAGNIQIHATGEVLLEGAGDISNDVFPNGSGQGGNLTIIAQSLRVLNGYQLSASASGRGNAGNLTIQVTDAVTLDGVSPENGFASSAFSVVDRNAIGNAGQIIITARSLNITDGAQVNTRTSGRGNAGDVVLNIRDRTLIDGRNILGSPSGIFSRVNVGAVGQGGNIDLTTGSLQISNGAQLSSSTSAQGNAGNVTVTAREQIALDGTDRFDFASGIYSRVNSTGRGQGGNIILNSRSLSITNSATLTASTRNEGKGGTIRINTIGDVAMQNTATIIADSQGADEAGNIDIQAERLTLSDRALISAEAFSNTGGNIQLTLPTLLLLRRNSSISTTAGKAQGSGDGGNIDINAGFVIAVPQEDSNITANAFRGRGGNVNVTTQRLLGIEGRDRLTPLSDITASSQFGINGTIVINTLTLDPLQSTVNLPTTFSQPPLAQGCLASSRVSSFKYTGRGGIPANPVDPLLAETIWQDVEPPEQREGETGGALRSAAPGEDGKTSASQQPTSHSEPILEAQGWIVLPDGKILLTADAPTVLPQAIDHSVISCVP